MMGSKGIGWQRLGSEGSGWQRLAEAGIRGDGISWDRLGGAAAKGDESIRTKVSKLSKKTHFMAKNKT